MRPFVSTGMCYKSRIQRFTEPFTVIFSALMENQYLFVYGTLKRNPGSVWHDRLIRDHFTYIGQAVVNAVLFNLGDYPGITEASEDSALVEGELYEFNPALISLSDIDEYEGCSPAYPDPPLYERKFVTAVSASNKAYQAWSYFYLGSTQELEPMGSSWLEIHTKTHGTSD